MSHVEASGVRGVASMLLACLLGLAGPAWAQDLEWEGQTRSRLAAMAADLVQRLKPWPVPDRQFAVEDYGAVADGQTVNTAAIQKAVDACSAQGGGVVAFRNGDYVTGTIELKSGVMIEVAEGARILGSTSLADYPERIESLPSINRDVHHFRQSLIYAERARRVGIRGKGQIDFRGEKTNFPGPQTTGPIVGRPFGIRMIQCSEIVLQDITLRNAAAWMQNYIACDDLIFERMQVYNQANFNNDGLDPDGCRNVIVRDCTINSEDDGMCFKGGSGRATENVLVENCRFYSTCNAFKYGTDTQGEFRMVMARNLTLGGVPPEVAKGGRAMQASTGITLATVDGGNLQDVMMTGIRIEYARCPVFLRVGNRARVIPGTARPPIGQFKRVIVEDVTGESNYRQGSLISGIAGGLVEDVALRRVRLQMEGGGTAKMARGEVEESVAGYPDAHQFGRKTGGLPAYGFWLRHARGVALEDVVVTTKTPDERPAFAAGGDVEDVSVNGKRP